MSGEASGVPARRYSWPPFEPGNVAAVKHGALSARLVGEDAAELLSQLQATGAPWLAEVDAIALDAWLYAVVAVRRLRAWLDANGLIDGDGNPTAAVDLWLKVERRLDRATKALGFDPLSRAQLGRDTAIARSAAADALDRVRETGRAALDGRQ